MTRITPSPRTAVLMVVVVALSLTPAAIARAQASPHATVFGALETVRADTAPSGRTTAQLTAARNEAESFQVAISGGDGGLTALRVEHGDPLRGPGGTILPGQVTISRASWYEATGVASDAEGGLGRWADALIPSVDLFDGQLRNAFTHPGFRLDVPPRENVVAWVDVLVPPGQAAGLYRGSLHVAAEDGFAQEVGIELTVVDLALPSSPTHHSAFAMTLRKVCAGHGLGGACGSAEEQWALYARYARTMLDNRLNVDYPAPGPPTSANRVLFDRYARPLFEGTAQGLRLPGAQQQEVHLYSWCDEGCVRAWRAEAEARGWSDRFTTYACDEPQDIASRWDACKAIAQRNREYWPGLRAAAIGATYQRAEQQQATDVIDQLNVLVNDLDVRPGDARRTSQGLSGDQRPTYDGWLAANRRHEVWAYQSCFSHGCENTDDHPSRCTPYATEQGYWNGWPSLAIDAPASQHRAGGWVGYAYGTAGESYYETVYAYDQTDGETTYELTDPWIEQYCYGGHGDGTLFYPGTPAKIGGTTHVPVESIRLKRLRDGMEDYELLHLAEAAGHGAEAHAVADRLVRPLYETTFGQSEVDAARAELIRLLGAFPDPSATAASTGPSAGPAPSGPPTPSPSPSGSDRAPTVTEPFELTRLAGVDRFATAARIATDGRDEAPTVLLATGNTFPDSLSGTYLAGRRDAPILLVQLDVVPAPTLEALRALGTRNVVLLGGTAAIGPEVETLLEGEGLHVERIGGADRFATAGLVAESGAADRVGEAVEGRRTALLAYGRNFPDALAAGPAAYDAALPLLLTESDRLPDATRDALRALGIQHVVLLGGRAVVAPAVEDELRTLGLTTERLSGANRFATAVAVASFFLDRLEADSGHADVARGDAPFDALAAGPHGGARRAPLYLTATDDVPESTCAALEALAGRVADGHVFGGSAAVDAETEEDLERCGSAAGGSATPAPSASPRATTSASATPTMSPSASVSPSPSASPNTGATAGPVPPPTGLSAIVVGPEAVSLSWEPASGATEQVVYRLATAGACPTTTDAMQRVAVLTGGDSREERSLQPDTRYCYAVVTIREGTESALDAGSTTQVRTPRRMPPVSLDIDVASDDDELGPGDTVIARFDSAVDVAAGESVVIQDGQDGDEHRLTCGQDSTCTVDGATLTISIDAPPQLVGKRGDGLAGMGGGSVVLASTIAGAGGAWDTAASGVEAAERTFGSADPTNASLHAPIEVGDVTIDATHDRLVVDDADCAPLAASDQVQLYGPAGNQMALGSDEDAANGCRVELAATLASGDVVHLLYRRAGLFTVSQSIALTVP